MNLLIEYFKSSNQERDYEYLFCISQNIQNILIENIFVFISDNSELSISNPKVKIVNIDNRPTFYDLIEYSNKNLNQQVNIIANTDIFFDETLQHVKNQDFDKLFLALTRWDVFKVGDKWMIKYYDHVWKDNITTGQMSQDAWIFKSPIQLDKRSKFLMGKPGCDNRISQIYHELGFDVKNPSKKVIIKHLHQTNYRTYGYADVVPGPYLLIKPSDEINSHSEIKTISNF